MGKATLSATDLHFVTEMTTADNHGEKILECIDGYRLDAHQGIVAIMCSDPYRRKDTIAHKEQILLNCYGHDLIFPVMFPGGALRLSEDSPANPRGRSIAVDMLDAAEVGMRVLKTEVIALYLHGPCALASECRIDFIRSIELLFKAKIYLKRKLAGRGHTKTRVPCFVHVDKGEDGMNTYFIRGSKFWPWRFNLPFPV